MHLKSLYLLITTATAIVWAGDKIELSGEHRAYLSFPATQSHNDFSGNIKAPRLENDLFLSAEHSNVTLHAGIRITNQLTQSNKEQSVSFRPLENSLSLNTGKLQTTLGFQNFFWGSADKLNPVDNINPRDYTTGLDAEKLPVFSLSFKAYPTDRISIEAAYAPFDQPDVFPLDVVDNIPGTLFSRSRLKSVSFVQSGIVTQIEQTVGVKNVIVNDPSFDPSSFLSGVRFKLMSGSFDIAASYIYDIDQYYTPDIQVEPYSLIDENTINNSLLTQQQLAAAMPTTIYGIKSISLNRDRIHRIGLDAKTVIDRFGIWGEACFSITEKKDDRPYESRGHQLDWTVGCDFSYGPSYQHYLNIQQIGRYILDFDSDFSKRYPDGKPASSDLFNQKAMQDFYYRLLTNRLAYATEGLLAGLAVRSEWSFLDGNLKPILECLYLYPFQYDNASGKRYGDLYGTARIDWKATDAVLLSIGTQGFYSIFKEKGSDEISNLDESKIGLYFPNSRVFIKGTFNWSR